MPSWKPFEDHLQSIMREPDEVEIQRRWFNAREVIMWRAVYAALHSVSYRPFPVGCAVWGLRTNAGPSDRWAVFNGSNVKAFAELPKVCAEITSLMGAMQGGYDRIVGMAIVGQPREEDQDSVLYPCENCRLTLRRIPIVREDTHVILARPRDADSFSHIVETTVGAIWQKFNTPRADP